MTLLLSTETVQSPNQSNFTFDINLEGIGIFLGILISLSILGNAAIKLIINSSIKHEIDNKIEEHTALHHRELEVKVSQLDRRVFELRARLGDDPDSSIL